MKKSILYSVVALMMITLSMTSSSESEAHVEDCEGMFTLEHDLILKMTSKYKNFQLNFINDRLRSSLSDTQGDSRAIWFSIDTLKEFICQIEANSKDISNEDLGIRIYYAAYPDISEWRRYTDLYASGDYKVNQAYEERHTLVLMPTQTQGNFIRDLIITENSQGNRVLSLTGVEIEGDEKPGKNHGSLFPPKIQTGMNY